MAKKIGKAAAADTYVPKPMEDLTKWDSSKVPTVNLIEVVENGYKVYGKYVVESRAVPLAIDGLLPVTRRVLYSMYQLGLDDGVKKVKAQKVVGDTMGNYHPHGDSSIYGAMQTSAGMKFMTGPRTGEWMTRGVNEPLIHGLGNWGDHTDGAAAPRYTECRLSTYASSVLLDSEYMACVPMTRNYDDTNTEPRLLPAKLPNLMVNGTDGIAVGIKTQFPGFEVDSVIACSLLALQGEITPKQCYENLVARFPWGGGNLDDESWKALLQGGGNAGTLYAYPEMEYDGKVLIIKSLLPKLSVVAIRNKCHKNNPMTEVVLDQIDKHGIRLVVKPKTMLQSERDLWAEDLQYKLYSTIAARVNILDFDIDGVADNATLVQSNIPDIFRTWAAWRVDIEKQVITKRIEKADLTRHRDELLLLICKNRPILMKSLETTDPSKYLCKELTLVADDGDWLISQAVKRFSKLSADDLTAKIAESKKRVIQLNKDLANPVPLVEASMSSIRI